MSDYIHLFETQAAHDAVYNGSTYTEPWVGLVTANGSVSYNVDYSKMPLTIEALEDGTLYLWYAEDFGENGYLEYSIDNGQSWTRVTNVDGEYCEISTALTTGSKALIRGENNCFGGESYGYVPDRMCGFDFGIGANTDKNLSRKQYNVSGNIMSLLFGSNFANKTSLPYLHDMTCFGSLFEDHAIVDAKNLILPATTLVEYCYAAMFRRCLNLVAAPKLPATVLAEGCYDMMFQDCTPLTIAPELPATTLAKYCYMEMFHNCTSLTKAPDLPAENLANYCYYQMFSGNSSLNYIKCLATNISTGSTESWLSSVSSTGTFVKNSSMTSWTTGTSGIPSGWTVQDAAL